jgi:uncharacterized protein YggE
MRLTLLSCCVVSLMLALAQPATAQAVEGAVTGVGMATLKRAPDVIRLQVQLTGDGKTLKEALAKLAARREACKKKLVALGAKEDAVTFDDAKIDAADPRQQMEQMMRMRMNRGGGRPPATSPAGAARVSVGAIVKAEWTLAGKSGEDLLVLAQDLQDKVKAADLAETKTASLEEQEAREERAGQDGSDEQAPPPGQPVFLYVAKISDQQRAEVLADAFKKAKSNAADLAKAAGAELGALKQLQSQAAPDMEQYQMMQYGRYNPYLMNQAQNPDPNEAIAAQPGPVTLRLTVSASFAIK